MDRHAIDVTRESRRPVRVKSILFGERVEVCTTASSFTFLEHVDEGPREETVACGACCARLVLGAKPRLKQAVRVVHRLQEGQ